MANDIATAALGAAPLIARPGDTHQKFVLILVDFDHIISFQSPGPINCVHWHADPPFECVLVKTHPYGIQHAFSIEQLPPAFREEPIKPTDQFTPDQDTIALYHFDEGSGDVLKDSSGNGHHGKIVGAKWVRTANGAAGDAPPTAVAPFDEAQAKAHQEAWAKHLGVPVETTNSIGMKLRLIPPGEFMMGEGDNTVPVILTKPFRLSVHEVTQGQWKTVMGTDPQARPVGPNFPVTSVTHDEAVAFCKKLTDRERTAGRIPDNGEYRLPTEAEFEYACRAGTTTKHYFGDERLEDHAWFGDTGRGSVAHEVGLKKANPWGLHDIYGNVGEWCSDWYVSELPGGSDPQGPSSGTKQVTRGGATASAGTHVHSGSRYAVPSTYRHNMAGFRVVLTLKTTPKQLLTPVVAKAPFLEPQAKAHQKAWADYLGLPVEQEVELPGGAKITFMLIPPGEFLMGSTEDERNRMVNSLGAKDAYVQQEGPQHFVRITRPYYLARVETTQAQWGSVMGMNPAKSPGPNRPVEQVSWDDIQPFLKKLNASTGTAGPKIILPTEAQWEHACRAGTTTAYWFGDDDTALANYEWCRIPNQKDGLPVDVGQLKPNPWGLYDMLGNVREWCADAGGRYQAIPATDPLNTTNALNARIRRGGSRVVTAWQCRSTSRGEAPSRESDGWVGFRLAMSIDTAKLKTAQTLPGEGDRALAEWLLTNRQNVNLMIGSTGARTFADTAAALPEGPIDLSGITLRGQQTVTVELLTRFAEAKHVESLNFQCDDELLARITELFPNLISLYTRGEQVTGAGLANLRPLRRLKRLSLHDCPNIGNDDLQHLAA
ncbi:MAG: formylglycine-generating enzyme family protein, partial [Planctomycetales bacterium]